MRLGPPFLVVLSAVLGNARSSSHFRHANEGQDAGDILASDKDWLTLQARALNETELNEVPQCAGQCLQEVAVRYGCAFEPDCFCNDGNITASIKACVGSNCTISEGLAAQKLEADTCNVPVRDRGGLSRRLCWAMFTIATLFVFGRFLSRMRQLGGSGLWFDDYAVFFCYALLVPTNVSCEIEVQNGLGMDMFRLSIGQIVKIMRWFYLGELFYNIIVMLTKVSLILLYLRIWTADSASSAFRITCWILIGILLSTATAGIFGIIFQCTPVDYAWLSISGTVQGHCIALEPFTYTYGALNISYDVIVFFLPIHSLLKLRVPWPKKLGLCSVFLVGFLVTICSIIRLQYLVRLSETQNISWNFQYIGMWSLVEANFSIVCCCMPAMAGLAQRIWSKSSTFSSSHGSRSRDAQQTGAGPGQSISGSPRSDSDPKCIETSLEKGHQDHLTQQEEESRSSQYHTMKRSRQLWMSSTEKGQMIDQRPPFCFGKEQKVVARGTMSKLPTNHPRRLPPLNYHTEITMISYTRLKSLTARNEELPTREVSELKERAKCRGWKRLALAKGLQGYLLQAQEVSAQTPHQASRLH